MYRLTSAAAALLALTLSAALNAQQFPSKPIRIVVPFAPAGRLTSRPATSRQR